jgi:hypothetical protein
LYLRGGVWRQRRILPADFVRRAGTTVDAVVGLDEVDARNYGNASDHYGLLWWNNADGSMPGVPRDAFWSWGLYDSLIVVMPSLDVVVARAGRSWKRASDEHYAVLRPFLEPIAAAAKKPASRAGDEKKKTDRSADRPPAREPPDDDLLERNRAGNGEQDLRSKRAAAPPYRPSPVIRGIEWAPASSIVRQARGSDNWPLTWADDDNLYTAYGDGKGFAPFVDKKLSMGLARIGGSAADFTAVNLRAATLETQGDGNRGKKASGLLMVDGVLYLWARNAGNAQLAWSSDRGKSWSWSDWKLTTSFGCPTFLNFGRNYAGARDEFVYIFSHDSDSAYEPADRMVLARVPSHRIRERNEYEFLQAVDADGRVAWTKNVADRGAVFENRGRCYRSGVTYNAALERYLWCQIIPGGDTRFEGGLSIYDAAEPWGPWTTAFYTEKWDVGPGESASIPTKWIGDDGMTINLVFSGDDCFAVRHGRLRVRMEGDVESPQ